jgi:hypothetical protein
MSTLVRGDFDAYMPAMSDSIKKSMAANDKVVFVTKFLNSGLDITRTPDLE